jgi:hypothetical protein
MTAATAKALLAVAQAAAQRKDRATERAARAILARDGYDPYTGRRA